MTECSTYTGDLLIQFDSTTDWDLLWQNGQPCMTDGFETAVMLSVFGEPDFWQNGITNNPSEKYISGFPDVVKQANVNQKTLNDGTEAIKRSLQWMISDSICESIDVSGEFLNVYSIGWNIDIIKGGVTSRYEINWNKGVIAVSRAA